MLPHVIHTFTGLSLSSPSPTLASITFALLLDTVWGQDAGDDHWQCSPLFVCLFITLWLKITLFSFVCPQWYSDTCWYSHIYSTVTTSNNSLSSYARGLTFKDHECHVSKLTLINSDHLPDLYSISDWVEDANIHGWLDIFTYLVEKLTNVSIREKIVACVWTTHSSNRLTFSAANIIQLVIR